MKYLILFATLVFAVHLQAQTLPSRVSEPQYIAVDSRDNVYVALKWGIVKITPDGTLTDLTTEAGKIAYLDQRWRNLIVDSRDNLYARTNAGDMIYKFGFGADNKFFGKRFAGERFDYKLEDGSIATARFNKISTMTIDKDDNIYLDDSYDKIKEVIGGNFVTDPYYAAAPVKTRGHAINHVIRKISLRNGMVTTLKTPDGKYIVPTNIFGIAVDNTGNLIYTSHGRFVGKIDLSTGSFSNLAGQPYKRQYCPVYTPGDVAKAELFVPYTLIINNSGEIIYADGRSHRLTKIAGGKVSTLAGNNIIEPCYANIGGRAQEGYKDGKALTALFHFPKGMAYDSKGNLFIADMSNDSIRKLSPDGIVTTFAK